MRPKKAPDKKKYLKFKTWFDHQVKKELPSMSKISLKLDISIGTIGRYFEKLDGEGKVELYVVNGKLRKIVKL